MTTNHLVVNRRGNVVDREFAALLGDLCIEHDLEKQIAEFVTQFLRPSFTCIFDRFEGLVSLFEKHWRERGVGLFSIPRAAVRRPQSIHQGYQIVECCRHNASLKCAGLNHKVTKTQSLFRCFRALESLWFNNHMQEEQPTFKVTDRRLFNADGSPRELPPEEKPEPKVEVAQEAAAPVAAAEQQVPEAPPEMSRQAEEAFNEEDIADAHDPASFVSFRMSIASNAASALGMMEHPVTHQRDVDVELGKHWIDVLGMLQKKTAGNLTPQEKRMLEGLLADLRMQYVSLVNSPQQARRFSGSDITGGR